MVWSWIFWKEYSRPEVLQGSTSEGSRWRLSHSLAAFHDAAALLRHALDNTPPFMQYRPSDVTRAYALIG